MRWCARRALGSLGQPPVPILPGEHREPLWPGGFVGSMTHCAGYRAAAVARSSDVMSIGIDAEPDLALPAGVIAVVSRRDDQEHICQLSRADPSRNWDRLLFCAKEAVFKAWYPLTHESLGFEGASVRISPSDRSFVAVLRVPAPILPNGGRLSVLTGRWAFSRGLIMATVVVGLHRFTHEDAAWRVCHDSS